MVSPSSLQLLLHRCRETNIDTYVTDELADFFGAGGNRLHPAGRHVGQQSIGDLPGPALRPATDHLAVDPDGRPGIAVRVEQRVAELAVVAEIPQPLLPPHRRWIECRQE